MSSKSSLNEASNLVSSESHMTEFEMVTLRRVCFQEDMSCKSVPFDQLELT